MSITEETIKAGVAEIKAFIQNGGMHYASSHAVNHFRSIHEHHFGEPCGEDGYPEALWEVVECFKNESQDYVQNEYILCDDGAFSHDGECLLEDCLADLEIEWQDRLIECLEEAEAICIESVNNP